MSRRRIRFWRGLALVLSVAVVALTAGASGGRGAPGRFVDGSSCRVKGLDGTPGTFTSPQAAVDSIPSNGQAFFKVNGTCVGTTTIAGKNIWLFGRMGQPPLLDAEGEGSVLTVTDQGYVHARHLTITGGAAVNGGGIDIVSGRADVGATVSGNEASGYGGGVYVAPGSNGLKCGSACTIEGNSAVSGGGGVYGGGEFWPGSVVTGNTVSAGDGGGIAVGTGGYAAVLGGNGHGQAAVADNSASGDGGGIWSAGTLTISGEVYGNTAGAGGGGVANVGGAVTIYGNGRRISGNSAAFGGGLLNRAGTVDLEIRGAVDANRATGNGGGIDNEGGTVTLSGKFTSVSQNAAGGLGGGVYNSPQSTLALTGYLSTIRDNTASEGGGVYNLGTLTVFGPGRHRINDNHPDNVYP